MFEHGGHVEDLSGRNPVLVEERGPFLRRSPRKRALDLRLQFETTALAILAADESRVGHEPLATDQAAQRLELLLFVRGDVQEAFAGPKRTRRARRDIFVAH